MAAPTGVSTATTTGGTLPAGTYYFKVVASDGIGTTIGSTEVSQAILAGEAIQISWSAVTGASSYRVYGNAQGAQNHYFETTATSYTYTTTTGSIAGTVPTVTTAYVSKITASGDSWFLGGEFGIGTASPARKLDIVDSGNPQLRLTYTSGNYVDFFVTSTANSTSTLIIDSPYSGTSDVVYIGAGGEGKLTVGVVDPWLIQNTSAATTSLYIRTSSTTQADDIIFQTAGTNERMRILENGNVGIGTTTPATRLHIEEATGIDAVRINTFRFRPLSPTELAMIDSGGNEVIIFDELSSPIIWSQSLSSEFKQGSFQYTTTSNDWVYLEKDQAGKYYNAGTFITISYDYKGIVEFLKFRTNTEIPFLTGMSAQVQVSDDNFSTVKDSITFELTTQTNTYEISALANARYVRVKFDFQTDNVSFSPRLISFEVWANLIQESSETTESSSQNQFEETPFLEKIISVIKDALERLGLFIKNGIAKLKELIVEKLTAGFAFLRNLETERVRTKEIEFIDKATGEIWCTWIENGEWKKIKGECQSSRGQTSPSVEALTQVIQTTTTESTTTESAIAESTSTETTGFEATSTEQVNQGQTLLDSTSTEATSTQPVCTPNWQCSDWQPLPDTVCGGETFTQTRNCTDLNNCGTDEGKPAETQEVTGTKECSPEI
jgi:hypothetical protein